MRHKTEPCTSLGLINPHTHTTVDKKKVAEKYQQSDTKQSCKKKKRKWNEKAITPDIMMLLNSRKDRPVL